MATLQSLADLGTPQTAAPEAPKHVQKLDSLGRAYATGKRKDAVARVWIKPGSGKIVINGRTAEVYFARPVLRMILAQPLQIAQREGQYDITVNVDGGGLSGQAGAAYGAHHVELTFALGGDQRLHQNHLEHGPREIGGTVLAVDGDLAGAPLHPHPGDRVLALAGGIGAALGVELLDVLRGFRSGGLSVLAQVGERLEGRHDIRLSRSCC